MKKIFSLCINAVVVVLGIFAFIDGVESLMKLSGFVGPDYMSKYFISAGAISIAFGVIAILLLLTNLYFGFKKKDDVAAVTASVGSVAMLVLYQALILVAAWIASSSSGTPQSELAYVIATWIVGLVGAGLLLLESLPTISLDIRKIFGLCGAIVSIVMFGLLCKDIKSLETLNVVFLLVSIIVLIAEFVLLFLTKEENKD